MVCAKRCGHSCSNGAMSTIGVTQIGDASDAGGLERVAVNIANFLPREKYRSHLCTTRADGPLAAVIAPHVNRLRLARPRRFDLRAIRRLKEYVREHDIRIPHQRRCLSPRACRRRCCCGTIILAGTPRGEPGRYCPPATSVPRSTVSPFQGTRPVEIVPGCSNGMPAGGVCPAKVLRLFRRLFARRRFGNVAAHRPGLAVVVMRQRARRASSRGRWSAGFVPETLQGGSQPVLHLAKTHTASEVVMVRFCVYLCCGLPPPTRRGRGDGRTSLLIPSAQYEELPARAEYAIEFSAPRETIKEACNNRQPCDRLMTDELRTRSLTSRM